MVNPLLRLLIRIIEEANCVEITPLDNIEAILDAIYDAEDYLRREGLWDDDDTEAAEDSGPTGGSIGPLT
jgi:hypothetical protein